MTRKTGSRVRFSIRRCEVLIPRLLPVTMLSLDEKPRAFRGCQRDGSMVEENCSYADRSGVNSLSGHDMDVIQNLVDIYRKKILVGCTACSYCVPCPNGVTIPENFAQLNMANCPRGLQS
jgi:hypothetical protein